MAQDCIVVVCTTRGTPLLLCSAASPACISISKINRICRALSSLHSLAPRRCAPSFVDLGCYHAACISVDIESELGFHIYCIARLPTRCSNDELLLCVNHLRHSLLRTPTALDVLKDADRVDKEQAQSNADEYSVNKELAFSEDAKTPFQTRADLLPFEASLIQPFVSTFPVRSSWLDPSRFQQSIGRCSLLRLSSSSNVAAAKPIRSNSKSPQSLLSPTSKQRKLQQQMQQKLSLLESNSHKFGPGGEGYYKQCVVLDTEPNGLPSKANADIQSALSFSNIGMWKLIHSQANALMATVDVTSISSLKRWLLICEGFCVVLQPVFFDEPLCLMLAVVDSPPSDIQQQLSIHNSLSSSSTASDGLTARNVMPTIQVDSTYQRVDPLSECFSMSVNVESMRAHRQQNDTWSQIHHYIDLLTLQLHSWTDSATVSSFLGVPSQAFTLSSIAECLSTTSSVSSIATAPVRRASRARVPALPQAADTVIPAPPPPKPDPWAQVTTSTQAAASAVAALAAGSSAPLPPNPTASNSANPRARRYHAADDAKLDDAATQLPRAPAPPSKPSSRRNSINNIAAPAESSDANTTPLTATNTVVPALKLPASHLSLTDAPDSLLSMLHPQAPESTEEILFNRRLSAASTGQRASALPPLQK